MRSYEMLQIILGKRRKNIWLKIGKHKSLEVRRINIIKHHDEEKCGDLLWTGGLEMGRIKYHVCYDLTNVSVYILLNQFYFGLSNFFL
jgi:hypothetical protein